jgi:uncharacterized protein (DUF488 family)
MQTAEFQHAFDELLQAATAARTAVMCAEALWWQCHRRLISDALVARGHDVRHIQSLDRAASHKLLSPARLAAGRLTYEADQGDLSV